MKNREKPTPSEHDMRTEDDNKRTINRLLNLYDTMLEEYTNVMQEPEDEGSLTYTDKLNLLKQLTTIADPLMRRWNITHQGYDSSVSKAQTKQDDSPTDTPPAKPAEQNKTNELLHAREIEPGVMETFTLSPSGEEQNNQIVKVKEIEPDLYEVLDPSGQSEQVRLRIVQSFHPDMLDTIKRMMVPFPEEADESESSAVTPNVPDT